MNKNLIWFMDEILKEGSWGMTYTKIYDYIKFELDKDPTIVVTEDQLHEEIVSTAERLLKNKYISRHNKKLLHRFLLDAKKIENNGLLVMSNQYSITKPVEDTQVYSEKYLNTIKEEMEISETIVDYRNVPLDFNDQIRLFLIKAHRKNHSSYGTQICNKILYDVNGKLTRTKRDDGDMYNSITIKNAEDMIVYEVKSSYSQNKNGEFRLAHVRDYHKLNYFVICFIDTQDNYQEYFYLVDKSFICENPEISLRPMIGSKKYNIDNVNIDKAVTLKKDYAFYILGKGNLLNGTSYDDLLNYFKEV